MAGGPVIDDGKARNVDPTRSRPAGSINTPGIYGTELNDLSRKLGVRNPSSLSQVAKEVKLKSDATWRCANGQHIKGEVFSFTTRSRVDQCRIGYLLKNGTHSFGQSYSSVPRNGSLTVDAAYDSISSRGFGRRTGRFMLHVQSNADGTSTFNIMFDKDVKLTRIDLGQGKSMLLEVKDGKVMLHEDKPKQTTPPIQSKTDNRSRGNTPQKQHPSHQQGTPSLQKKQDEPTRVPFGVSPSDTSKKGSVPPLGVSPSDARDKTRVPLGVSSSEPKSNPPFGVTPSEKKAVPFGITPNRVTPNGEPGLYNAEEVKNGAPIISNGIILPSFNFDGSGASSSGAENKQTSDQTMVTGNSAMANIVAARAIQDLPEAIDKHQDKKIEKTTRAEKQLKKAYDAAKEAAPERATTGQKQKEALKKLRKLEASIEKNTHSEIKRVERRISQLPEGDARATALKQRIDALNLQREKFIASQKDLADKLSGSEKKSHVKLGKRELIRLEGQIEKAHQTEIERLQRNGRNVDAEKSKWESTKNRINEYKNDPKVKGRIRTLAKSAGDAIAERTPEGIRNRVAGARDRVASIRERGIRQSTVDGVRSRFDARLMNRSNATVVAPLADAPTMDDVTKISKIHSGLEKLEERMIANNPDLKDSPSEELNKVRENKSKIALKRDTVLAKAIESAETPEIKAQLEKARYIDHAEATQQACQKLGRDLPDNFETDRVRVSVEQKNAAWSSEIGKSKEYRLLTREINNSKQLTRNITDPEIAIVHKEHTHSLRMERQLYREQQILDRMKAEGLEKSVIEKQEAQVKSVAGKRTDALDGFLEKSEKQLARTDIESSHKKQILSARNRMERVVLDEDLVEIERQKSEEISRTRQQVSDAEEGLEKAKQEKAQKRSSSDIEEANKKVTEAEREVRTAKKTAAETELTKLKEVKERIAIEIKSADDELKSTSISEEERAAIEERKTRLQRKLDGVEAAEKYQTDQRVITKLEERIATSQQRIVDLEKQLKATPDTDPDTKQKIRQDIEKQRKFIKDTQTKVKVQTRQMNGYAMQKVRAFGRHFMNDRISKAMQKHPVKTSLGLAAITEVTTRLATSDYSDESRHTYVPRLLLMMSQHPEEWEFKTASTGKTLAVGMETASAAGDLVLVTGGMYGLQGLAVRIPAVHSLASGVTGHIVGKGLVGVGAFAHGYFTFNKGQFAYANDRQLKGMTASPIAGGAIGGAVIGSAFGPVGTAGGAFIGGGVAATGELYAVSVGLAHIQSECENDTEKWEARYSIELGNQGFRYPKNHPMVSKRRAELARNEVAQEVIDDMARAHAMHRVLTSSPVSIDGSRKLEALSSKEIEALGMKPERGNMTKAEKEEAGLHNWNHLPVLMGETWLGSDINDVMQENYKAGSAFLEAYEEAKAHFTELYVEGMHVEYHSQTKTSATQLFWGELFGSRGGVTMNTTEITREKNKYIKKALDDLENLYQQYPNLSPEQFNTYMQDKFPGIGAIMSNRDVARHFYNSVPEDHSLKPVMASLLLSTEDKVSELMDTLQELDQQLTYSQ